jgi:rhodanese-related sulfurtransferase
MCKRRLLFLPALILLAALLLSISGCDYITGNAPEFSQPVKSQEQVIKNVSPTEAYAVIALYAGHYNFTVIDVRTHPEYAAGHIPGAINRDLNSPSFRDDIDKFNKSNIYLVYCQTGGRSAAARDIMRELGFLHIYNMTGGISAWIAQGLPVVK